MYKNNLFSRLATKLKGGDKRSKIAQRNIFYSVFIKGFGILTSLALVPLTLGFLNAKEYGIWLTLNSILLWINNFDIGLGNGLRNKLAECLAVDDYATAKKYVSTGYVIISLVVGVIFFLFLILNNFLDWYSILNVQAFEVPNLASIVTISFTLFCVNFVLKLVGNVLLAMQKTAVDNLLIMMGQVISLVCIYILTKTTHGDLFKVAFVYSMAPVVVHAISYPFVFSGKFRIIAPNILYFRKEYVRQLIGIGTQFFVLQIAGVIIFSTANVLISNMFGPDSVTVYNIAFRYYNVVLIVFSIVLAPIWSATTDAYINKDFDWIKRSMKKVKYLLCLTFFGIVIMTFLSNIAYKLWVGKSVLVPNEMSALMGLYTFVLVSSLSVSSFLNGIGKLRIQMLNIVICAIIFIPLVYLLTRYIGIYGILLSLSLVNLSGLILNIIQFNKLMGHRAVGLWNK
ncbi:oligosaccharide flippase family protein [Sphingobacterium oryzagri]|uniref:Oligosaccharide flippase family protein n=1 Tax=Sphingobacterium oryzagri TaxID=3025669 RepID=A0ABY7WH54_9SPHI|nr:oligosaccharide flippase family protein [Sphingobacterium sp. KACC 22765]WDF68962.1 oligosaccharide flippase family protein [Sphingobacterium sp. KACC 22765]